MNKNTFYAIFLSFLIVTVSFYIQVRFFPPAPSENRALASESENTVESFVKAVSATNEKEETVSIETDVFSVTLSSKNAVVKSLTRIRTINGKKEAVALLPPSHRDDAFRLLLSSSHQKAKASGDAFEKIEDVFFDVSRPSEHTVVFSRDFVTQDEQTFRVRKTYMFKDDENVFQLLVSIQNEKNEVLNLGDSAYTLTFGPQLGPVDEIVGVKKKTRAGRRWFVTLLGNKTKNINLKAGRESAQNNQYKWSGIAGRYFSLLVLTNTAQYKTTFSTYPVQGLASGGQLAYTRAPIQSSAVEDVFRIYVGPSGDAAALAKYNDADANAFGISNARFDKIKPRRLLGFLERLFSWLLRGLYTLIPNYGIAIILLTLLVRFATLPILRKSKKNAEKMKSLGPKMKEIKERFPDDPMRQNQEMMALYKREHFSPFSSMFGMMIQIPFFLAMYRVIYENFDLWRQPFFGWMNDLSEPDRLLSFGEFVLPVLGWKALNVLPIIMLCTQFFSSLILTKQQSQAGSASPMGGKGMMMMLSYGFPCIIFFALYNSPSGLILYWIVSNLFTVVTMIDKKKTSEAITADAKSSATETKRAALAEQKGRKNNKKTFMQRLQAYANEQTKMARKRR